MSIAATEPSRTRSALLGGLGLPIVVGVWELLGQGEVFGRGWPPASDVFRTTIDDWSQVLGPALRNTMWAAARGFVIGLMAGFTLASIRLLVTPLRRGIGRLATLLNSIPWIALGPLIVMLVSTSATPVVFAAMAVFFSSFVAISSGFDLVGKAHHDVMTVAGASKLSRFRRLDLTDEKGLFWFDKDLIAGTMYELLELGGIDPPDVDTLYDISILEDAYAGCQPSILNC